ncbi:type II CRISPR RNA-guided endonuclease Cas9 [Exiguobacterium sp. s55]|uniref:type II CRISPR RNA-guided endonuclease Cas9 n=1 Tax=Exiguobacterium sp. s55 TaxID=2751245 RepID=UPI001BE99CD5|nr:type II CRISPR RNA-guided endonuclease Cas9 [Exiguobacterium sp. s55]
MSKKSISRYQQKIKNRYDGNYTLGLDIGTNSVGWAVIDDSYQIPVYKGKKAWGVRRFDQGNTAENRRLKRGGRRRINRRAKRLEYLKEIFQEGLQDVDENFLRAYELFEDESSLDSIERHKRELTEHSLQKVLKVISRSQKEYKELFNLYPTMFHLRYAMISNPNQKFDLRLVYLAIHHIVKKRGHFIQEGLEIKELLKIDSLQIQALIEEISEHYSEESIRLTNEEAKLFTNILRDVHLTRNDRAKKAKAIHKSLEVYAKALLGMKFSVNLLFDIESDDKKIEFNKELDLQIEELSEVLDTTQVQYLHDLQQLYTSLIFEDLMRGSNSISEAKVKEFDDYKVQLKALKSLLEKDTEVYKEVFLTPKKIMKEWTKTRQKELYKKFSLLDRYNYSDVNTKTDILDHENFSKALEKILKQVDDSETKEEILSALKNRTFLRKLNRRDNGSIPYQLHLAEAEKILNNQKTFHRVVDDEVIEKVCKLISFRIPYYVGPLVDNGHSEFAWVERTGEAIRPWNFKETVDHAVSAERFVSRMVGSCTFLYQEKALPKQSLTYQLYEVLNEINVVKVDGKRISKSERNELFKLFLTYKKVSIRDASKQLGDKKITGTSKENEFSSSLRSWQEMSQLIGQIDPEKIFSDAYDSHHMKRFEMAEQLILWITVFSDRAILKTKIEDEYPKLKNIKKVLSLNYNGWGQLSNRLLVEMISRKHNIIQTMMYESKLGRDRDEICYGFQEIITDKYLGFSKAIENYNLEKRGDNKQIKLEWVQELAGSPAVKRGIWQAFKLIEEFERVFGKPKRIILETAREDQINRKRTKSREEQWEELLKKSPNDLALQEMKDEKIDFRNLKVWLYLTQGTRCAYSNESLHIDRIEQYEIDHIIPYSISSDDSLDNKVLVKKKLNQDKAGHLMPLEIISADKRAEMKMVWYSWYEKGLISSKKYHRLLTETITPAMANGFINRQLVETRQITKHIIELLNHRYQGEESKPDILGLKAGMNSKVQKELGIEKVREVNDKHHAVDAYMVAVIAEFIYAIGKGTWIDGGEYWKRYRSTSESFESYRRKNSWIVKEMKRNGLVNVQGEKLTQADSISIYQWLLRQIDDTRFCVTRKLETNGEDQKFWNETLYSPKSKKSTLPDSVGKQYLGVYSSVNVAESVLCSLRLKKGKQYVTEYRLESISYYERKEPKATLLEKRFAKELHGKYEAESVRVIKRLPLNSLLLMDNHPVHLLSKKEVRNAKQIDYPQSFLKKIKSVNKGMKVEDLLSIIDDLEDKVRVHFSFASDGQLNKMKSSLEEIKEKLMRVDQSDSRIFNVGGELLSNTDLGEEARQVIYQLIDILQPSSKRVDVWKGMGRLNVNVLSANNLRLLSYSISGLEERIEVLKINGEYVC